MAKDRKSSHRIEPRAYISRGPALNLLNRIANKLGGSQGGETSSPETILWRNTSSDSDDEQDHQMERSVGGVGVGGGGGGGSTSTGGAHNKAQKKIENAASHIGNMLKEVLTQTEHVPKSWTIFKVPQNLKDTYGATSFEPKIVCIGPLYYLTSRFEAMKTHKWRFFARFLNSMNNSSTSTTAAAASESSTTVVATDHNKKIECLFVSMKKLEASTRAFYSEDIKLILRSEIFVRMMMIDGCFVIELLRLCEKLGKEEVVDPLFSSPWTIPNLRRDLLKLENQLPFPVLETLFEMSTNSGNVDQHQHSLKYLILKFFNPLLPRKKKVLDHVLTVVKDKKPHHLLDFFRSSFRTQQEATHNTHINVVNPSDSNEDDQDRLVLIRSVTELKVAGIEFKKRENHNLLDIEFKNGKLYIPPLFIDENTCSVFLNFLVYEQCNQYLEPYFTNYLLFLDSLVDSSTDIEDLHSNGIIDHVLSSDAQVADLFNKLCKEAVHDLADNYLSNVLKDVNRYSGRRWNRWMAAWKGTYFKNPWAFSSFLAAVFLLILTTIQTFFTAYAYFAPPS